MNSALNKTSKESRLEVLQTVRQLLRSRSYEECLEVSRKASERFPRDAELKLLTAQAQMELRCYDQAERIYRDLVGDEARRSKACLGLAQVYWNRNDLEKCVEIGLFAEKEGCALPQTSNLLGQALLKLDRSSEAENVFQRLTAVYRESAIGYLGLARLFIQQKAWESCDEVGLRAKANGLIHPQITNLHGQALMELRRFQDLRAILADYFHSTGVMDRHMVPGPAVSDKRLAVPALMSMYRKACIGCGDYAAAVRFELEISNANAQGEAMRKLFGGCAAYLPYFDNTILGDT